jgi:hypothetical protein
LAFDVDASQINFPNGNVDYSKLNDQVVAIDPYNMVVLNLINGFSFGRPVWYLSMDASIPLAAAIEHNTYAPLMDKLLLGDDDTFGSPIERIFLATNGPESGGCNNPLRQGLSADLADSFRPNNVLGGIPTLALDYSPTWDAQLHTWTDDAINQGFRGQLKDEFTILTLVQDGLLTGFPPRGPIYHLTLLHQLSNCSASLLNDERACRFSHQNRRAFQHSQSRAAAQEKPSGPRSTFTM